jgi:phosphoglucomutase
MLKEKHNVHFIQLENDLEDAGSNFAFQHMKPAMDHAKEHDFDLVFGLDSSKSKISLAVKKNVTGEFILLNVHQLSVLLANHRITNLRDTKHTFLKSFNMTEMIDSIVMGAGHSCIRKVMAPDALQEETLKLQQELEAEHITSFSENQEFFDTDKSFEELIQEIIEMEEALRPLEKTCFDKLVDLYYRHGFYKERAFMVDFPSTQQRDLLLKKMNALARDPRILSDRMDVTKIIDYNKGVSNNLQTNKKLLLDEPKVNLLRIESGRDISITFVPGEDKMYYYVSIRGKLKSKNDYEEMNKELNVRMLKLVEMINKL